MTTSHIDDTQIRETAYLLWLEEGCPEGRDEQHWLKAIDALTPPQPKKKPARAAANKQRAQKVKADVKTDDASKKKAVARRRAQRAAKAE